ncbi:hypothetical protein K503DRAFT_776849 [Rhizopogon vinicolor AM-OR11-026]|uniref:Uncharacterized protein n=1 Tax=Rhizopogon vinicolor AM-OR11-026 TaxID=1314800 RepID=A0A1B7MI26_9AGAM|nr:hypothetical protein K503DRAFT_776849 [Rhizopogon vinicolor AM-OR11-026]
MLILPKGTLLPPPASHHAPATKMRHPGILPCTYSWPQIRLSSSHHSTPTTTTCPPLSSQRFRTSALTTQACPWEYPHTVTGLNWYSSIILHRFPASDHVLVHTLKMP